MGRACGQQTVHFRVGNPLMQFIIRHESAQCCICGSFSPSISPSTASVLFCPTPILPFLSDADCFCPLHHLCTYLQQRFLPPCCYLSGPEQNKNTNGWVPSLRVRLRQDSNLRGRSPMDFKSISLTTRTHNQVQLDTRSPTHREVCQLKAVRWDS